MMKKIRLTVKIVFCLTLIGLVGCNDFLNVKPEDQILDSELFKTQSGIHKALNGIYMDITTPDLYGKNLTMGAIDIMAQYYNLEDSRNSKGIFANYSYNDNEAVSTFKDTWSAAYRVIMECNSFIKHMNKYPDAISKEEADMLRGEALGLRAMLHFDMLRLFGPVYQNNSSAEAVPYYREVTNEAQDILPADKVVDLIEKDLNDAEKLLKKDPIIENGVQTSIDEGTVDYFEFRNRRMNYYAINALQARVYLWAGNTDMAYDKATKVIDEAEEWFPWIKVEDLFQAGDNPNRIFSTEVIFGIENHKMYNQQKNLFSPSLFLSEILAPHPERLDQLYTDQNDYRYRSWWQLTAEKGFKTFFKYAEVQAGLSQYFQPLLRISEMYFIAAETAQTENEGLEYLNTVRHHRGLQDLPGSANIDDELTAAYRREFYGEGQMFFYYKRKDIGTIPDASQALAFYTISMDASKYIIPLPDDEIEYR